ncbi:hypothetical protein [Mesorhizobium sp. M2A.F.Ca.ET.037.01.1.1]|uniref:hypothetical protein n=1 Tax=Mesorhizobium sp. M2A.F.Ca.ET.037.01.1.1 TaxID=2496748 RepID=UPI001FDFE6BD|nr:hypothetical protein [Mesorhizobium sp. M2A.F.Ca.ET.037.01.1.1]
MLNPATFDFPIIKETIRGAWAADVIRGNPALEPSYIAAAQRLVERGAVAITSDCGFSIRHQAAVANSVNVPVATSSLLLVPALLRQLPSSSKLAILTADSKSCGFELLGVEDPAERARLVIGGVEGGKLLQNEMKRPPIPTEVADIEADVAGCITRIRSEHPEIAAILFECTGFPTVSHTMRRSTKLPIYDIVDVCKMMMGSIA